MHVLAPRYPGSDCLLLPYWCTLARGRGTVNLEEFTAWFTGGCPLPGRAVSLLEAEEAEVEVEEATSALDAELLVEAAEAKGRGVLAEAEALTREIVDTDA